jgi:chromosome segregation ATPase
MWEFRQLASVLRKEEEKDRDDAHTGGRDRVRTKELEQKANEAASKAAALARAQEGLAAENASLQEELTKLQADEEAKEARIGQLEAEASELRKMATSAANAEEVATVQAKQEEEAVRMAEELKVEQRKGKELERDLAALQRKYDGLQRELAGVQEEAASRQEAIARAEAERAAEIALVPNPALGPNEYQILGRPMLGGTLRVKRPQPAYETFCRFPFPRATSSVHLHYQRQHHSLSCCSQGFSSDC